MGVSSGVEPAVDADDAGDYVVVWEDFSIEVDGGVRGRKFNSVGSPVGGVFQVNTYTTGYQSRPDVAVSGSGEFMVTWFSAVSPGDDTSSYSIQGRIYDSAGGPNGDQFQINTTTTDGQYYPPK